MFSFFSCKPKKVKINMEKIVDVAIIGAGSAGLFALSEVKKHTDRFLLINGGPYGTTCARVGCMPSKVMIQVADTFYHRHALAKQGIQGGEQLRLDIPAALRHLRQLRDEFVSGVLNSVERLRKKDVVLDGYAEFVEPTVLTVDQQHTIRAKHVIIATGTTPVVPKPWQQWRDRILTTDEIFEQTDLPPKMAVLGLGVIGLELGQALSRLGLDITGMDMVETIGGLQDPEVQAVAIALIRQEFPLWLGQAAELSAHGDQLCVTSGEQQIVVDKVLASLGRKPNIAGLGLEQLGIALDDKGMPPFDRQTLQIGELPIFIAGDVNADRPLLHEAGDEGRMAGFNAVNPIQRFQRKPRFALTFCDPNIVSIGETWQALQAQADQVAIGEYHFDTQGRAKIIGNNRGILRLYADKSTGKLLGTEMIAPQGEHLGHLLAWAIQHELTVFDLLKLPFYHPTLEEGLQAALYDLKGEVDGRDEPLTEVAAVGKKANARHH